MEISEISDIMFYGGIALASVSVLLGLISVIVFSLTGHLLRLQLDKEYGKKRS